jgi:hypothetical protein
MKTKLIPAAILAAMMAIPHKPLLIVKLPMKSDTTA